MRIQKIVPSLAALVLGLTLSFAAQAAQSGEAGNANAKDATAECCCCNSGDHAKADGAHCKKGEDAAAKDGCCAGCNHEKAADAEKGKSCCAHHGAASDAKTKPQN